MNMHNPPLAVPMRHANSKPGPLDRSPPQHSSTGGEKGGLASPVTKILQGVPSTTWPRPYARLRGRGCYLRFALHAATLSIVLLILSLGLQLGVQPAIGLASIE